MSTELDDAARAPDIEAVISYYIASPWHRHRAEKHLPFVQHLPSLADAAAFDEVDQLDTLGKLTRSEQVSLA